MDFSANSRDDSTRLFLNQVGECFSERRDEIPQLLISACKTTWKSALRELKTTGYRTCKHAIIEQDTHTPQKRRTSQNSSQGLRTLSYRTSKTSSSARRVSDLIEIADDAVHDNSSAYSQSSHHASELFIATDDSGSVATSSSSTDSGYGTTTPRYRSREISTKLSCQDCASNDTSVFPFVSDVTPLAILMVLEAIKNHGELSLHPMTPAYISCRPEYLSYGMSFRVTRVPWEQVRADTDGRIVQDAVYKRLNHTASRGAWLDFMKDLVVVHHMTYHVSEAHKRNVVKLIGVGWERMSDDTTDEPVFAPVIALEYASYGTLQDLYYSSAFLSSYQQKIRLLSDVAEGLQALHYSNIVHGDVKPSNILICKDHEHGLIAKLSDFGLAVIDPDAGPELQQMPGGTSEYLAPEASRKIPKDQLKYTDIYSFGILAWQTLLGGTMPFFSKRYADAAILSEVEIRDLKCGKHQKLADAYGYQLDERNFRALNESKELEMSRYTAPKDDVNELIVSMAQDNLGPLCRPDEHTVEAAGIPFSEIGVLLSIVQVSLSSCPVHRRLDNILILLGRKLERGPISVSKIVWDEKVELALETSLRYQTASARAKELYSSTFENFFAVLQNDANSHELNNLSHWDGTLAKSLGASLVNHYLCRYLEGDHSEETRASILSYLALCSSAGDVSMFAASLGLHQLLGARMKYADMYTTGTACALYAGDSALWNVELPECEQFQAHLTKGSIMLMQDSMDFQQTQIAGHVLMGYDVGPFDIHHQDEEGNTLLHLACQSANFPLVLQLIEDHGASASIENNYGEEPIHWLHRIPTTMSDVVEAVTVLLVSAGADIDAFAPPRMGDYTDSVSNIHLFPTPLLRAIARRNFSAVCSLVARGADVSLSNEIYARLGISPLTLAASMLEYECLEIMLLDWEPTSDPRDPDNSEVRGLWEQAISGLEAIERVKLHGHLYHEHVRKTVDILTQYLGRGWLVQNAKSTLMYAVEGGDLVWVEVLLASLYENPRMAVLADLQQGIQSSVAYGHRNISEKLMAYGALPLLPQRWSGHDFTVGRHGKWNEELIDRLVNEMYRQGIISAQTTCALHFLARGGSTAVALAADIVQKPVTNDCLKPALPDANNYGLPHFVTALIDGEHRKLDRPDEEHHTPLYEAMAYAEFKLARYFLEQDASYQVREWSLVAQLFEDGRPSLPQQIEFLLRQPRPPPFRITRRTFGRLQTALEWGLHPEADMKNWHLEEHTMITATAQACTAFDRFNKRRCWKAVLKSFHTSDQILAKSGDGRDALEIAIDGADTVTLVMLLEALAHHPSVFKTYTALGRVLRMLSSSLPCDIADGVSKRKIIRYRCTLGDMARALLQAGDIGTTQALPSDTAARVIENFTDEFPILLIGFQQRGVEQESAEQFRLETEMFTNAFLLGLSSRQDEESWNGMVDKVRRDLTRLLSPYFIVTFKRTQERGLRQVVAVLTSKIALLASSTTQIGNVQAANPPIREVSIRPLVDYSAYRTSIVAEQRMSDTTNTLPVPNWQNARAISSRLRSEESELSPSETLVSSTLEAFLPNRCISLPERKDRDEPAYYHAPVLSTGKDMADQKLGTKIGKTRYFSNVVKAINPTAKSVAQDEMIHSIRDLVIVHAENIAATRTLSALDPEDLHPLFGKMKAIYADGSMRYVDLPMQAYTDGMRRLAERWGVPFGGGDDSSSGEEDAGWEERVTPPGLRRWM